jgi:hypothetical protein
VVDSDLDEQVRDPPDEAHRSEKCPASATHGLAEASAKHLHQAETAGARRRQGTPTCGAC